jgi:tetratricopeptide (TPR) repeat protein
MATLLGFALLELPSCARSPEPGEGHSIGELRKSGTIQVDVTIRPELKGEFDTALALLHSFFYEEARRRFLEIAARDPECAMAWWGVAMTWYHPLWAPPTPEEMKNGALAAQKAQEIGGRSELEKGFIAAIDAFFSADDAPAPAEPVAETYHGPRVYSARALCFRQGIERLRQKYPQNVEVLTFYALALLGTAPPTDKLYKNQLAAVAILDSLAEKNPDHPGITHYLIHACDYPALASRGLPAAQQYKDIAPWVPHALHMPSHIYTRLGMWKESIEANRDSSVAAREYSAQFHGSATTNEEVHAMDYMEYAYLQTGQDRKAGEIVKRLGEIQKFYPERDFATAYAVGDIPARFTLERRRWTEAAGLPTPHPDLLRHFPFAEAHLAFARAVGGARGGSLESARASLARLAQLRESLIDPKFQWWINQIEIERLAASGWVARAEGRTAEGEELLRQAAALEDKAGTHPVSPGQILPAHEQLGDYLLDRGRPREALAEYEKSIEAFPSRFNGYFGAARAAEQIGQTESARKYYQRLVEMSHDGDGSREELALARTYLSRTP